MLSRFPCGLTRRNTYTKAEKRELHTYSLSHHIDKYYADFFLIFLESYKALNKTNLLLRIHFIKHLIELVREGERLMLSCDLGYEIDAK